MDPWQPDDSGAARTSEAGCRAGRKPEHAAGLLPNLRFGALGEGQVRLIAAEMATASVTPAYP